MIPRFGEGDGDRVATSGQTARAYHGVDAGAGRRPRTILGDDEFPTAGIERGDRRFDRDLHLAGRGRCGSGGRVDRAVPDQKEGAARRDSCPHPPDHLLNRSRYMDVQAGHKVVVTRLRGPGLKIGLDQVDAPGDVRPGGLGRRSGVSQGGRGEIDCCDMPSVGREPECVGSVTAARVEGATGAQVPDLGGQMRVRGAIRDGIRTLAQGP
jgi:hypothetical protein